METRARYALIGLFMLAVILASFGFVYWLENKGGFGERETYRVRFESSVSGLLIGSAVLFNGIRIGEVTGVALNPDAPQQVIATISVVKNTPIREDTRVNVEQQGLTGGVAVTLTGGTSTTPPSAASGVVDVPPVSVTATPPVRPCCSTLTRVSSRIGVFLTTEMVAITCCGASGLRATPVTSPMRMPLNSTAEPMRRPDTELSNRTR